jgi:hypothetical protein
MRVSARVIDFLAPFFDSAWCDKQKRAERPYKLAGVSNIVLHDIQVVTCLRCRRSEPVISDLEGLTRAVAMAIVGKRQRLSSSEIRFLESARVRERASYVTQAIEIC